MGEVPGTSYLIVLFVSTPFHPIFITIGSCGKKGYSIYLPMINNRQSADQLLIIGIACGTDMS